MLLSIATHKRELVLKCMLHAIPYTKRVPIETVVERAKQIRFHLDCYEYNPKDLTFGVEIAQNSKSRARVIALYISSILVRAFLETPTSLLARPHQVRCRPSLFWRDNKHRDSHEGAARNTRLCPAPAS